MVLDLGFCGVRCGAFRPKIRHGLHTGMPTEQSAAKETWYKDNQRVIGVRFIQMGSEKVKAIGATENWKENGCFTTHKAGWKPLCHTRPDGNRVKRPHGIPWGH